ncbi:MAG: NFACT RNA binding domain-containing protein [Candidatus Pacearchaeota archaeon]
MVFDYKKYRWFFTSSGTLVIGGKSDSQNEEVIREAKPNEVVLHTKSPGSPFCIIKEAIEETSEDIKEAAIFCACFSQAWKKSKGKPIEVHVFSRSQIEKKKSMKKGTFGIKGKYKSIKVEPKLWLTFQEGVLRAVPFESDIAMITPGEMKKEAAALEISKKLEIPVEEVMSALPADGISVKWL